MHVRRIASITTTGLLILSLTACSSDSTDVAAEGTSTEPAVIDTTDYCETYTSQGDEFPVTINHALGTTTIDKAPERVASIGWGNQDVALALGVAPIGSDDQTWTWDMSDGLGLYDWTLDAYKKLGAPEPAVFSNSDGPDYEAISDVKPDLILAGMSGLDNEQYAKLSEIAPVAAFTGTAWNTPWREVICIDSAALGKASEGQKLVDSLEDTIITASEGADFSGKTAAFFYMSADDLSTVSVYKEGDGRTALLRDLGFSLPEMAQNKDGDTSFYQDIGSENADKLNDVDVIVSYGEGDALLKALRDDPIWKTVPAVQNGAVVVVGGGDAYSGAVTPTALSIPWVIDRYVADLKTASDSVK